MVSDKMKRLQNFLAGMDLLLFCMLAGHAAERGIIDFTKKEIMGNQQVQFVQAKAEKEDGVRNSREDQAEKKIALTFDDGPNPEYTEKLLAGLKERGVKATFFLLGKEVERYPEIVEKMYEDGHLIGNHSYEHINLGSLSDEAAISQVDKTNQAICKITGEYPEYIRPPYGCWKSNLDYETTMIEVLWNVDPLDWRTPNADVVTKKVIESVEENDIILLHDASETSVQAAFQIIDTLTKAGYTFVTVDKILFD